MSIIFIIIFGLFLGYVIIVTARIYDFVDIYFIIPSLLKTKPISFTKNEYDYLPNKIIYCINYDNYKIRVVNSLFIPFHRKESWYLEATKITGETIYIFKLSNSLKNKVLKHYDNN